LAGTGDLWAAGMSEGAFILAKRIKQQNGAKNQRQNQIDPLMDQ